MVFFKKFYKIIRLLLGGMMSSKLEVWKCYSYAINPSLQNKWGVGREIFFKRREYIKEISSPLSTYFFAPLLTVGLAWFFPQLIFSPHLFLLSLVLYVFHIFPYFYRIIDRSCSSLSIESSGWYHWSVTL